LTGTQPIIFPRYGLILFTLGVPILAWTFLRLREQKPRWARRLLVCTLSICLGDAGIQFSGAVGTLNQISVQRAVADYLRDHFDAKSDARIFCDEGTVQVLSGIPAERFITSFDAPRDREEFLTYLKAKKVECLIFVVSTSSTPNRLLPDLEYGYYNQSFEAVMNSHTEFLYTHIWLYRVHSEGP
jgi:hypothetical protein